MTEEIDPTKIDRTSWNRHEGLYSSVGQAISMWASMESEIIEIAALLLGTSERKAGLVFYSMNFFAWLAVIDELFSMDPLYEPLKPDWGPCSSTLRMLNDTRVRLAHHTVWDPPSKDAPTGLHPGKHDARNKSRKHSALTDGEIIKFTGDVLKVSDKLRAVMTAMRAAEPPSKPFLSSLFGQTEIPLDVLSAALKAHPQSSHE